jgi:hypothetical protein
MAGLGSDSGALIEEVFWEFERAGEGLLRPFAGLGKSSFPSADLLDRKTDEPGESFLAEEAFSPGGCETAREITFHHAHQD